jgi:hypothetical protein
MQNVERRKLVKKKKDPELSKRGEIWKEKMENSEQPSAIQS